MLDPIQTPDQSKRAIIALLFKLMGSDRDENLKELGYVMHVGMQLGLDDDDLKEIKINKDQYYLQPPIEERDRVTILYYLLFFMKADGQIRSEEEEMVRHFSVKLGFRPEMTSDLISVLKNHLDTDVPPEDMLTKIRAYLNLSLIHI